MKTSVISYRDFRRGLDLRGGDRQGVVGGDSVNDHQRLIELTNCFINKGRNVQVRGGTEEVTRKPLPDGYIGLVTTEDERYLVRYGDDKAVGLGDVKVIVEPDVTRPEKTPVRVEQSASFGDGVYFVVMYEPSAEGAAVLGEDEKYEHFFLTKEQMEAAVEGSVFPRLIGLELSRAVALMPRAAGAISATQVNKGNVALAFSGFDGRVVWQQVVAGLDVDDPPQVCDVLLGESVGAFPGYDGETPEDPVLGFGGVVPAAVPVLYGRNQPVSGMAEFGVQGSEVTVSGISDLQIEVRMPDGDEHLLVHVEGDSVRFPMVSPSGWEHIVVGVYLWSKPDGFSAPGDYCDTLEFPNWYMGDGARRAVFTMFKLGADRQVRSHWRGYWQ